MTDTPQPGWYQDPSNPAVQRYWDGTAWTDHTAAAAPQPPVAAGGFVAQAPMGAGGYAPLGAAAPDPWLWQSIVATVVCCLCAGFAGFFGIPAIVYASGSQKAASIGDLATATEKARLARIWTIVTLVAGVVLFGVFLAFGLLDEILRNY